MRRFWSNYLLRHTHRANRVLHLIGVPLTFVVSLMLLRRGYGWWSLASFVSGYLLQFAGHAIEGNDAGEVVLVKRLLGLPYREFAEGKESKSGD